MLTSLTHYHESELIDETVDAVSSLADTWINLQNEDSGGQRVRSLLIVKSRGMGHLTSRQNFVIAEKGIRFQKDETK
jgi:circadian clock protein KaiC